VKYVVGADEVGLGPLAGDIYVCAVMVPEDGKNVEGVTDSKALTPADRERLREELIVLPNLHYEISRATPEEIDEPSVPAFPRLSHRINPRCAGWVQSGDDRCYREIG